MENGSRDPNSSIDGEAEKLFCLLSNVYNDERFKARLKAQIDKDKWLEWVDGEFALHQRLEIHSHSHLSSKQAF